MAAVRCQCSSDTIPSRSHVARTDTAHLVGRCVDTASNAPVNALGYLRVMFVVDDIDDTLETLRKRGAQLVGEVVR